jgi:FlaA1/EpsC-like NDP-sugar epimerase
MRRPLLLILWLASDLVIFVGACTLAYFLRTGWIWSTDFPFDRFLVAACVAAVPWLGTLVVTRTFALTRRQASPKHIAYMLYSGAVGTAFLAIAYYFLYQSLFSRLLLAEAGALSTFAVLLWHMIFGYVMRRALTAGRPVFPTVVVGVTRESIQMIERLRLRHHPLRPVAILDVRGAKEKEIAGVPVCGKLNKLEDVLREHGITHLIHASDLEQSINLLSACRAHGITYMLLPSVLGMVERDERIESLDGYPVTVVSPERSVWSWFFR